VSLPPDNFVGQTSLCSSTKRRQDSELALEIEGLPGTARRG
jgi:hypothetical protein